MNNYQVLGLKGSETKDEIKSKFRSLSKQLHPDVNGGDSSKTKKFIEVLKAYNELMEGVTGETKKQDIYNDYYGYDKKTGSSGSSNKWKSKKAEYRFIGITRNKKGGEYIVSFFMSGVKKVAIYGLKGDIIAMYDIDEGSRVYNLKLDESDAKLAKYQFRIVLYDRNLNSGTVTYKVKKPKSRIIDLFETCVMNLPKLLLWCVLLYVLFIILFNFL